MPRCVHSAENFGQYIPQVRTPNMLLRQSRTCRNIICFVLS